MQLAEKAVFASRKNILLLNLSYTVNSKFLVKQSYLFTCEVWDFEKLHMKEKIHKEFLRDIYVNKSTPLNMIYGKPVRNSLEIHIKCKIIGYWSILVLGKHEKLPFTDYQMLYHFNDNDDRNKKIMTIKIIKKILDDVDLGYI